MKTKKGQISVIVPAYNEERYIQGCLNSLLNQNIAKHLYEVIVVDNASTDATANIAKKNGARLVKESNKGYVHALIKGVDKSTGEILAFTDADCRVPENWLAKFLEKFDRDPQLDAVGGVFAFWDGNKILKMLALKTQRFTWHLSGGNMAIRKKSLAKIGGFNTSVDAGADVLISLKLQKQGKFIIDKTNVVQTSSRRFSASFLKTILMYFPNDFFLKYFHRPLFSRFPDIR